jgi:predicted nucleic acid-binding protein
LGATIVVDASVVFDLLTLGSHDAPALRLLRALAWADPITLMAPDLVFLETANAVRKQSSRRGIAPAHADRAVATLGTLPIAAVGCSRLLESAWTLRGAFSVYDAAYVSLARELDLPYLTEDGRAAKSAERAGVRAWRLGGPELKDLLDALEPLADDPTTGRG